MKKFDEATSEDLRAAGYKEWTKTTDDLSHHHALSHFQKKVEDPLGVKYFINAYEYPIGTTSSFQWESQFCPSSEGFSVNITPICRSVEEAEMFFESFWNLYTELGIIDYYERRV